MSLNLNNLKLFINCYRNYLRYHLSILLKNKCLANTIDYIYNYFRAF